MNQSETIGKLAEALAKAQGQIIGALKDSKNPFFKSSYADLSSTIEASRIPLAENNLAVIQTTEVAEAAVIIVTTLAHSSGEWIRGHLRMVPVKNDPQGIGSCITYGRRYGRAAIVGVAQIDDDANAASGKSHYNDPRGEEWKSVDPERAKGVAQAIRDHIAKDTDGNYIKKQCDMVQLLARLNSADQAVWIAGEQLLTSKERNEFKSRSSEKREVA